ncbi:MAG: hypothetical protein ACJATX_000127 [Candidatus Paceibacteria bacterium]|jgi:hypothetical protein
MEYIFENTPGVQAGYAIALIFNERVSKITKYILQVPLR